MTSKYRESEKRAGGFYAFEWLSRYFDVIHWPFYVAPLKVEGASSVQGEGDSSLRGLEGRMPRARLQLQAHIITVLNQTTTTAAPRDINKSVTSLYKGIFTRHIWYLWFCLICFDSEHPGVCVQWTGAGCWTTYSLSDTVCFLISCYFV